MSDSDSPVQDSEITAVRQFNRLYTRTIGVLDQHLFKSPFSLTEARVLYELAHRDNPTAKEISTSLGLDAGYLSRIVQNFNEQGLITRKSLPSDRRQYSLGLTVRGRIAFGKLNEKSHGSVREMLASLSANHRTQLVDSMTNIERLLHHYENSAPPDARQPILRTHRPGDMGWVVQQNGAFYTREYNWDSSYEGLVAEIVAQFLKTFDPTSERCWIAELDNERVGSVFLVRRSDEIAKLRLLLVEPAGRGIGLGKTLVHECIAFARACGYRKITLWTQSILLAARRIYAEAGFVHTASEPHHSFGHDLIGETWELDLR